MESVGQAAVEADQNESADTTNRVRFRQRGSVSELLLATFVALVALALSGCGRTGDEEPNDENTPTVHLSQDYVTSFVDYATKKAKWECLRRELQHLKPMTSLGRVHLLSDEGIFGITSRVEPQTQVTLAALLQQASQPYVAATVKSQVAVQKKRDDLVACWQAIRVSLVEAQQALFQDRASTKVQGQLATLLSMDNSWFWFFFAISIASVVGVVIHERRHALRRWLNGGKPQALGLSTILSVLLILLIALLLSFLVFGDALYDYLLVLGTGEESPRTAAQTQLQELTQKNEELSKQLEAVEKQYNDTALSVQRRLDTELKLAPALVSQWKQTRQAITDSMIAIDVQLAVARSLEADLTTLDNVQKDLENEKDKTIRFARTKRKIRFGLGFFLLSITFGGGWVFQRGLRKRQKQITDTCPVCLEPSFKKVPLRGTAGADMVCDSKLLGVECGFQNKESYRKLPKLCFATLGHVASGKTFWLALCYRQLKLGKGVPSNVHSEKLKSPGSQKLDDILHYIFEDRAAPDATDPGAMPRPVLFNFRDRDPWGKTQELITIFDYSGEITEQDLSSARISLADAQLTQRERALKADGFLYFLDPTLPSDVQMSSLESFREDIKDLMQLGAGDQVRSPVALCLSKIDLLGSMPSYADPKGAIGKFYEALTEIYPPETTEPVSMVRIRQASDLVKQLLPIIWDDWEIENEMKKLFGGRIMFFPMTPIGLGVPFENPFDSIEDRNISPYHLLEPMLWLVHMTGHLILDEMSLASRILAKINRI